MPVLREEDRRSVRQRILPASERVIENLRSSYASGQSSYVDLIEAQRTLLNVRLAIAEARTMREKRLAELERLAGVDVETLLAPTSPNTIATSGTTHRATASAPEIIPHD